MPPFVLFQKSSKLGNRYLDADQRYSPLQSFTSDPFRPGTLSSHPPHPPPPSLFQPNLSSSANLVATPDKKMGTIRRVSTPWMMHSPEYCARPLVVEPVLIMAPPYHVCDQYPSFRSCWRPEHVRTHVVYASGPEWINCAPKLSPYWTVPIRTPPHLIPTGRVDASPLCARDCTRYHPTPPVVVSGKQFKKRGKDIRKRLPRTCKHCQQSTCQGASTRRSKGFRCATCPKCLTKCLGRCEDSFISTAVESGGEQKQDS